MKKILSVFGTRPEAIKMAPVVKRLADSEWCDSRVCVTAQHREMLDQVLEIFEIIPEYDLDIMTPGQTLPQITAKILMGVTDVLKAFKPDLVLVHGDTSTTFATSLAAYYEQIPIGHVEAGLRTQSIYNPWPEEANRRLTGGLAALHFAPTANSKANLIAEKCDASKIYVTGNTVIDSLLFIRKKINSDKNIKMEMEKKFQYLDEYDRLILVTGHRRENFGEGFEEVCIALTKIAKDNPRDLIIFPVHLNPNVQRPAKLILGEQPNIKLISPQPYLEFVYLMDRSFFIVSDSGGIQEEAPSLGKPVLVTRVSTERPEAVAAGTVELVGVSSSKIRAFAQRLLDDKEFYALRAKAKNPYGDGRAAEQICNAILERK